MKTKLHHLFVALTLLALLTLDSQLSTCFAQGTAFTYQGQLQNNGSPASGSYDLTFSLFAINAGGVAVAGPVTNSAIAVTNGLFTAAIDFGAGVFTGGSNWLQIAVSTNGANTFSTLLPRQQLTPVPYAISANTAANLINGLTIQPNSDGAPNVIGGSPVNFVSSGVVGATVAGGGATTDSDYGYSNSVTASYGTVSGGLRNTASGEDATVSGGFNNTASGLHDTVSGGAGNTASGGDATVSGGYGNTASGYASFAAGSQANAINDFSFVWNDSDNGYFSSTTNNQFAVHATGGARFVTGSAGLTLGSSGQYYAPGGQENLRIIRGVFSATGSIIVGAGFSVTHTSTGVYTITFTTSFPSAPAATATADSGGGNAQWR